MLVTTHSPPASFLERSLNHSVPGMNCGPGYFQRYHVASGGTLVVIFSHPTGAARGMSEIHSR